MEAATFPLSVAPRPRAFVRVAGPDAADYLQRMVSNDVEALEPGGSCEALLLTPKARVIAPLLVVRRAADDFLLLTEPELGETVAQHLLRMRFAARAEIEPEQHASVLVLGAEGPLENHDYGVPAHELIDEPGPPAARRLGEEELERLRVEAGAPRFGREIDERVMPAEAGLVERAVSFTKGCYPGQEPIARLHYRGHANRSLRRLEIEGEPPSYDAEILLGDRVVGRVTSAVPGAALGYLRTDVPEEAELTVAGMPVRAR